MNIYCKHYYGFVYIWFDRKSQMYYVGSHMGPLNDGYIGSNKHFQFAYKKRPQDFKRRILYYHQTNDRQSLLEVEQCWLNYIKENELNKKYFNLKKYANGGFKPNHDETTKLKIRKILQQQIKDGIFPPLLHSSKIQKERIKAGIHIFCGENHPSKIASQNGTHHFFGGEIQKQRVKNKTHNFLNSEFSKFHQAKLLKEGKHHSQKEYICPHCSKAGRGNVFKQWHFDNCLKNPNITQEQTDKILARKHRLNNK